MPRPGVTFGNVQGEGIAVVTKVTHLRNLMTA
jgi:hypothetical protein